jgi:RelA/SpoT family (p)ppGpp synthetase
VDSAILPEPDALASRDRLLATVAKHHAEAAGDAARDPALVERAWSLLEPLRERFPGAIRSGLAAATTLADMKLDPGAVAATLIAALPPEAELASEPVSEALGEEVLGLIENVRRLSAVHWERLDEHSAEVLRKMFLALAKDVRVVLIALALRVQLVRSNLVPRGMDAKQLARETLGVYAPLANRLGIWQFKWELEDAAFRELHPETFAELTRLLAEKQAHREALIKDCIVELSAKLEQEGVQATVNGRPKHAYSIYRKMQTKQISFDRIYDVSAVRVMTERVQDCYAALGVVHSLWVPIPHEFDDYIAMPKDNGYQSLHTAVVGPNGRAVEIQIRTRDMHRFAEFGVAAHWAYKEGKKGDKLKQDRFMLLRQLLDWEREVIDPKQFVESLKTDLFEDQVFVFTPDGDIIDLPKGSTPIDFAYRVHTMVGHRCRGARVNDQIVPLDYQLKTGDRLEILTHKQPQPSRDWMNASLGYLKTASARSKVRHWFREQGRQSAVLAGREAVHRELARVEHKHVSVEAIALDLGYADTDDLYAAIGFGDRRSQVVATSALALEEKLEGKSVKKPEPTPAAPPVKRIVPTTGIVIDGSDDIVGRSARCCNALPGEDVVGFVTRGRGLVIHRRDCANVQDTSEPERLVDVRWGPYPDELHVVLDLETSDRPGVLGDLLRMVSHLGAYIANAEAQSNKSGRSLLRLNLDFKNARAVEQVLHRLDHHPDVLEVRRVGQ